MFVSCSCGALMQGVFVRIKRDRGYMFKGIAGITALAKRTAVRLNRRNIIWYAGCIESSACGEY